MRSRVHSTCSQARVLSFLKATVHLLLILLTTTTGLHSLCQHRIFWQGISSSTEIPSLNWLPYNPTLPIHRLSHIHCHLLDIFKNRTVLDPSTPPTKQTHLRPYSERRKPPESCWKLFKIRLTGVGLSSGWLERGNAFDEPVLHALWSERSWCLLCYISP